MLNNLFGFRALIYYESFILIALALGLLGVRFFFATFMKQDSPYRFSHLTILMLFTVFSSELILVFVILYYLNNPDIYVQLAPNEITYYILFPQFMFFFTFCYFFYWLLKFFKAKQDYYMRFKNQYESTLVKVESYFENIRTDTFKQDMVMLIANPDFNFSYFSEIIFKSNCLIWNHYSDKIPLESDCNLDAAIQEIDSLFQYHVIILDQFTILQILKSN